MKSEMKISQDYNTSEDYDLLFDLVYKQHKNIVCFVAEVIKEEIYQSIAIFSKKPFHLQLSSVGVGYITFFITQLIQNKN